jgi:taurine dioxygenase
MRLQPLGPAIGASVTGLDLIRPIRDHERDASLAALLQHHVLFFGDQPITARQQRDLAARFGELHIHPVYPQHPEVPEIFLLDTSNDNPLDNDNWHTDVNFIRTAPMEATLSADQRRGSNPLQCRARRSSGAARSDGTEFTD